MANEGLKGFENCATLQEIQLRSWDPSNETPIKLLSQLKKFRMIDQSSSIIVNASDCTRLETL